MKHFIRKAPAASVNFRETMRFIESAAHDRNRNKTILIVEDEAPIRLLMWHILEQAGYRVLLGIDGIDGLRQLNIGARIDLLITDLSMPGMSGIELANRALKRIPDLKVIYATGSRDCFPETKTEISCLTKPFGVEELLAAVEEQLAEHIESFGI